MSYETDKISWGKKQAELLQNCCFSEMDVENLTKELESIKPDGEKLEYKETLVGFFDIQAYSCYIRTTKMSSATCNITHLFSSINSLSSDLGNLKIDVHILSDSIILVLDTNRHKLCFNTTLWFLATCSHLMRMMINFPIKYTNNRGHHVQTDDNFPVRGAVGGGYFYKKGSVIVSSGLVDAADYEKKQNWLGAVITPNAYELISRAPISDDPNEKKVGIDLLSEKFMQYVRVGHIPWKKGENVPCTKHPQKYFYIKPHVVSVGQDLLKNIPDYFNDEEKIRNSRLLYGTI